MARNSANAGKSLDQLEKPPSNPHTRTAHSAQVRLARQIPLRDLSAEQLLTLLHTGEGTAHLVPFALDKAEEDPWAAVEFDPGDLLLALLALRPRQLPTGPQGLARLVAISQAAIKAAAKGPRHLRNPGVEAEVKTWLSQHKGK